MCAVGCAWACVCVHLCIYPFVCTCVADLQFYLSYNKLKYLLHEVHIVFN